MFPASATFKSQHFLKYCLTLSKIGASLHCNKLYQANTVMFILYSVTLTHFRNNTNRRVRWGGGNMVKVINVFLF